MQKENSNFTKTKLQDLQPKDKVYYINDKNTPYLRLAVYPSGIKTFLLCRKVQGRPERIKIGRLSDLSIEQARKQAHQFNAHIALGGNPQNDKYALRREPTFKDLFEYYYHTHALHFTKRPNDNRKSVEFHLLPIFGNMKASLITTEKVRGLHVSLSERTTPSNANRIIGLISAIYNVCIKNSYYKGTNPCSFVKRFKAISRDRFLSKSELDKFFESVKKEEQLLRHFFLMLLYTGARKSNVLSMKWADIDLNLERWRIPEYQSKNGEVNIVHLSEHAIEILNERHLTNNKVSTPSLYVFPSSGAKGYLNDPKKAFERIKKRMEVSDFRMHDLRRTFGSYMAINGASLPIIGKALNHKSQISTAIYARLSAEPVRDAVNSAINLIKGNDQITVFRINAKMVNPELEAMHFSMLFK